MLISVHLPKTAGTSFRQVLESRFGSGLRLDYADQPLHRSPLRRRSAALKTCLLPGPQGLEGVECIHGHFLPLKYSGLKRTAAVQFVTWLRDPIERLASHFYYWQRSYDPREAGPLHRRMIEEQWDLERFGFAPQLCNVYSQFLWRFPLTRFAYLGITEHYDEDVRGFAAAFLGAPVSTSEAHNVNTQRSPARTTVPAAPAHATGSNAPAPKSPAQAPYIQDKTFRAALERHHARDMALYEQALARRAVRVGSAASPLGTEARL